MEPVCLSRTAPWGVRFKPQQSFSGSERAKLRRVFKKAVWPSRGASVVAIFRSAYFDLIGNWPLCACRYQMSNGTVSQLSICLAKKQKQKKNNGHNKHPQCIIVVIVPSISCLVCDSHFQRCLSYLFYFSPCFSGKKTQLSCVTWRLAFFFLHCVGCVHVQ